MAVRFVQISDLHLGRNWGAGRLPADLQAALAAAALGALHNACDLVAEVDAAALLIAGDLFDRPEVEEELLVAVQQALAHVARPVLVVPGNHDALGPTSVWNAALLGELDLPPWPANVHIFTSRAFTPVSVADGAAQVFGHCVAGYDSATDSPLAALQLPARPPLRILLFHGALLARAEQRSTLPFTLPQLKDLDADYAAVGHYHRGRALEVPGRILGAYAGTPVPGDVGEDPHGGVLVAEVAEGRVALHWHLPHPGRFVRLDVVPNEPIDSPEQALAAVRTAAAHAALGPEDIVFVRMGGASTIPLDTTALTSALAADFRFVEMIDESEPLQVRPGGRDTIERRFLEQLEARLQQTDQAAEQELLRAARHYGLLALRGRDVRPFAAQRSAEESEHHRGYVDDAH
ncbi:MAG: metallophosphoesterase [Phycisphaerales bacterium]|nr:metallophosphoesterase [Phycisphaerales bacterium]